MPKSILKIGREQIEKWILIWLYILGFLEPNGLWASIYEIAWPNIVKRKCTALKYCIFSNDSPLPIAYSNFKANFQHFHFLGWLCDSEWHFLCCIPFFIFWKWIQRFHTEQNTTQTQIQRMSRELPGARGVAGWMKRRKGEAEIGSDETGRGRAGWHRERSRWHSQLWVPGGRETPQGDHAVNGTNVWPPCSTPEPDRLLNVNCNWKKRKQRDTWSQWCKDSSARISEKQLFDVANPRELLHEQPRSVGCSRNNSERLRHCLMTSPT